MPVGAGRDHRSRLQGSVRKRLRRLERVWIDWPIYFITTCAFRRRTILASKNVAEILVSEWRNAHERHGWVNGALCHYARSCAFLLFCGTGWEDITYVYAGVEAVEQ